MPKVSIDQILKSAADSVVSTETTHTTITANQVQTPDTASKEGLVFVSNAQGLSKACAGGAAIILVPHNLDLQDTPTDNILIYKDRSFAMAQILGLFEEESLSSTLIHPTAQISASAQLGKMVRVGAYSVIGDGVSIADQSQIDDHVVIEAHCQIGAHTRVCSFSFIARRTEIGRGCYIKPHACVGQEGFGIAPTRTGNHRIPQIGRVVLEDEVEIGSFTCIDRATIGETRIKKGAKLDNHIHIAHNCEIGQYCLLAAGYKTAGSTVLGDRVMTGGGVLVGDHLTIASGTVLAGASVVRQSITEPGQYGGDPLQPVKKFLKTLMALPELPNMKKHYKQQLRKDHS